MRRIALVISLAAVATLGLPEVGLAAREPAPAWGVSQRVAAGRFHWGMDMGVDAAGHVHLVAAGFRNGKAGVFYTTDRTGSWVTSRILTWAAGAVYIRPSVAVDGAGRVHVALDRVECVECTVSRTLGVFYLTDAGRARGSFGTPVRLTPKGTSQGSLRVAGGHLFVAYAGGWGDTFTAVRLRTNASGHWTTSVIATAGADPFLRLSMDGKPRVVFETANRLRYARASSRTGGWTVEPITGTAAASDDPVLSIDRGGRAHVAWVDTSAATWLGRYGRRVAGTWSIAGTLGPAEAIALSVDLPSDVWMLETGTGVSSVDGDGAMFHRVTFFLGGITRTPAIKVLDSGAVVAAWTGGDASGIWISWN